jgi:hypothetical protein
VAGLTASPILGPEGNREFLLYLASQGGDVEIDALIERALGSVVA